MLKRIIVAFLAGICVLFHTEAQKILITGVVTDEHGELMIGVNVVVKEEVHNGTITDLDGEYSLYVDDPNRTLIFSSIGYRTQEIICSGRSVIHVRMEEDTYVFSDPVVRVYTQDMRRRDMASPAVIPMHGYTDMRAAGYADMSMFLNGIVPGMYMQQGSGIFSGIPNVRSGIGHVGGEVRYVVDNVIDAPFNFSEVDRMQVVKTPHGETVYSTATSPGGMIYIQTDDQSYLPRPWIIANAWLGIQEPVALFPDNNKDKYASQTGSGLLQHYDFRFGNKTDRFRIWGNASYDKVEGTLAHTNGKRFSARLVMNYRPKSWLELSETVYYDFQKQEQDWFYHGSEDAPEISGENFEVKRIRHNPSDEVFSTTTIKLTPLRWIHIHSTFSYDRIDTRGEQANNNPWYPTYRNYFDYRNQENSLTKRWVWNNMATGSFYAGYNHEISFLAGFSREETRLTTNDPSAYEEPARKRNHVSDNFLLRGSYNYNQGIRIFSAAVRQLSSSLPRREDKHIRLPSFSATWNLLKEQFMGYNYYNDYIVSAFRVNAGWGKTAHVGLYMPITAEYGYGSPGFLYKDLTWQVTTQTDAGVEFRFFREEVLSLAVNYYYKNTDHLPENKKEPEEGTITLYSGDAHITNKGWEVSARLHGSSGYFSDPMLWQVGGNFTMNRSSVKNNPEDTRLLSVCNYVAPEYYYGIDGNIKTDKVGIGLRFTGAAEMYLSRNAFFNGFAEDVTKVNYFALQLVHITYEQNMARIARNLRTEFYIHAENLFFKANSSLKNDRTMDYVAYPVNRMMSIGMKIHL